MATWTLNRRGWQASRTRGSRQGLQSTAMTPGFEGAGGGKLGSLVVLSTSSKASSSWCCCGMAAVTADVGAARATDTCPEESFLPVGDVVSRLHDPLQTSMGRAGLDLLNQSTPLLTS